MVETKIVTTRLAKKYNQVIFKGFDHTFYGPSIVGISGSNGAGKSTLLQVLCGYIQPSHGQIDYYINAQKQSYLEVARKIAITAPYIQLIEEFTVDEMIEFHQHYTPMQYDKNQFLNHVYLGDHGDKYLHQLSSGMLQRLQLGLTLCNSNKPIIMLDEPSSFLDAKAKAWMYDQVMMRKKDTLIIIASNDAEDLKLCDTIVPIENYKA